MNRREDHNIGNMKETRNKQEYREGKEIKWFKVIYPYKFWIKKYRCKIASSIK